MTLPPAHPALFPVRAHLAAAFAHGRPTPAIWTALARAAGLTNAQGLPITFVPPTHPPPPALAFERRIFETGEVETRDNWHDIFHACAWLAFPLAKARINALHVADGRYASANGRSDLRNVLSLFDEGGMAVVSREPALLDDLRAFAWRRLFVERRALVPHAMDFVVFGHALNERILNLHHGSTAKAVLIEVDDPYFGQEPMARVAWLDARLAAMIGGPAFPATGRALQPVPVKGIPGWAPENENPAYYDDVLQFRPGRREALAC
jgi:hypothetical protein